MNVNVIQETHELSVRTETGALVTLTKYLESKKYDAKTFMRIKQRIYQKSGERDRRPIDYNDPIMEPAAKARGNARGVRIAVKCLYITKDGEVYTTPPQDVKDLLLILQPTKNKYIRGVNTYDVDEELL